MALVSTISSCSPLLLHILHIVCNVLLECFTRALQCFIFSQILTFHESTMSLDIVNQFARNIRLRKTSLESKEYYLKNIYIYTSIFLQWDIKERRRKSSYLPFFGGEEEKRKFLVHRSFFVSIQQNCQYAYIRRIFIQLIAAY
jgi:hypothetical protein